MPHEKIITKGDPVGSLVVLLESDACDDAKQKVGLKSQILAEESLHDKNRGQTHPKNYFSEGE